MKTIKVLMIICVMLASTNIKSQIRVLSNGNTGIGDLTPSERLEINGGNCLIYGGSDLILKDDGTDPGDVVFRSSSNTEYGRIFTFSNAMRFRARSNSGGDLNIMHSNGYVSIGYFTPSYKLDVAGYIRGWNLTPSDKRFKDDIKPIKNSRAFLRKMNGVSYIISENVGKDNKGYLTDSIMPSYIFKDNKRHFGFIAQDIQEILPDLVHKDSSGYLSLDYISVIPLLVNAFNEQQDIIDAQS